MEDHSLDHELKVIKIQVNKIDEVLNGIQDHYRHNLTKLYRDLTASLEIVEKIKERIDKEIEFLDKLETMDKSSIDLSSYFSDD